MITASGSALPMSNDHFLERGRGEENRVGKDGSEE
jgi:hypothetical protein